MKPKKFQICKHLYDTFHIQNGMKRRDAWQ